MDLYEVIKIPTFILQLTGQWPSQHRTLSAKVRNTITTMIQVLLSLIIVTEACFLYNDFKALVQLLAFCSPTISYLMKMIVIKANEGEFIILHKFLNDVTLSNIPSDRKYHIQNAFQFAKIVGVYYLLHCGVTVTMICIFPLIFFHGRKLPVQFTAFNLGHLYPIMYVFQCIGLCNAAANNSCLDYLAWGVMCLVKGQVCLLNENIRRFREFADTERQEEEDLRAAYYMRDCVNHHNKIIMLVERAEKVFSIIILLQYLTSIVIICNVGFQLKIVEIISFHFLLLLSLFLAMICELGMYCWFGNEIIVNSSAIRDACYESDWINSNAHIRKMLLIIMERSKRPLYLTAGKFSILSLASFTSVINAAYSFFALMQRMYSQSEDK